MDNRTGKTAAYFIAAGVVFLLCGYLLYLLFRSPAAVVHTLPLSGLIRSLLPAEAVRYSWADWAPSFIHVVAFALISAGLLGTARFTWLAIPSVWLFTSVAFELGQKYRYALSDELPAFLSDTSTVHFIDGFFRFGTFDPADMAAAVAGFLVAGAVLYQARGMRGVLAGNRFQSMFRYARPVLISFVSVFGILCILATSERPHCDEPIYLTYEELRAPVAATEPLPVAGGGKIYLYGNYLLVNQPNKGIHVINNADPHAPVNLRFIPIPGNLDIAVKDNVLYADSYVDLVAIDISDVGNIHEVKRIQDVFSYNPYQNIEDSSVYFCSYDERNGVVVDAGQTR